MNQRYHDIAESKDVEVYLEEIFGSYNRHCLDYQSSVTVTEIISRTITTATFKSTEPVLPGQFSTTASVSVSVSDSSIFPETTNSDLSSNGTFFNSSNSPANSSGFGLHHMIVTGVCSGAAALLVGCLVYWQRRRRRSQGQHSEHQAKRKEKDLEGSLKCQSIIVDVDGSSIRDTITLAGLDGGSWMEKNGSPTPRVEMDIDSGACELDLDNGHGEMIVEMSLRVELSTESGYGELEGSLSGTRPAAWNQG